MFVAVCAGKPGLIAEVKKASPSKGVIQPDFDAVRIAAAYEAGGAACLSVLTDEKFFQGSFDNLAKIKAAGVSCPLLAKEFVVEAYQIYKARVSGADAVLLIAAVLPNQVCAGAGQRRHTRWHGPALACCVSCSLVSPAVSYPRWPAISLPSSTVFFFLLPSSPPTHPSSPTHPAWPLPL